MSLAKALALFSLVVGALALATPHLYDGHHHRAVAARIAQPKSIYNDLLTPRKRSLGKRCRSHPTASSSSSSSATSSQTVQHADAQSPSSQTDTQTSTTEYAPPPPSTTQDAPQYTPPPPSITQDSPQYTPPPPQYTPPPPQAASNVGNQPSYMIGTQSGDGTFYSTGLGSCGITNNDSEYICAVSHLMYDSFPGYQSGNPNDNPICRRQVIATYQGKSVTLTITDRCEGCQMTDLDMSPAAFNQLADPSVGRIHGMTWVWK